MKDEFDVYEDMPTMNGRVYPQDMMRKAIEEMLSKEEKMKQCGCVCECKRMVEDDQKFCNVCKGLQSITIKERFLRFLSVIWRYV